MKKTLLLRIILALLITLLTTDAIAQFEPFSTSVLNTRPGAGNYRLAHPFDIIYGPDDYLYITEKIGRIVRVDTGTGVRQILLDHRAHVALNITRGGGGGATSIGQNGMLGLALHPQFYHDPNKDSIYVAYSYTLSLIRISRFKLNRTPTPSLTGETVLIEGIPASNDHSTGRLIVGGDDKLYYSCGDLGNNQFNNKCNPIRSQLLPTLAEVNAHDYSDYSGKVLRLNLDGSIPSDNPIWSGVRSHIFTVGHRNPQGLVWERWQSSGFTPLVLNPAGKLFSTEHGPNTDDEINILEGGRNYGWPNIAGDSDNVNYQYVNWSSATNCPGEGFVESPFHVPPGATVRQETQAPASVKANFRPPMKSVWRDCGSVPASQCEIANGWLKYPTIAPSSIEYYHLYSGMGIPNWYPSLLVPTLRRGVLYRFKLNTARTAIIGDSIPYFRSINRYRDIALSPDGKIYIITDSIGSTSGPSGSNQTNLQNRGAILVFTNIGAVLPLRDHVLPPIVRPDYHVNVFPNPATTTVNVEFDKTMRLPVRYRVFDIVGNLVMDRLSSKDNFNIDVSGFKRGVYIFKLYNSTGAELAVEKLVLR